VVRSPAPVQATLQRGRSPNKYRHDCQARSAFGQIPPDWSGSTPNRTERKHWAAPPVGRRMQRAEGLRRRVPRVQRGRQQASCQHGRRDHNSPYPIEAVAHPPLAPAPRRRYRGQLKPSTSIKLRCGSGPIRLRPVPGRNAGRRPRTLITGDSPVILGRPPSFPQPPSARSATPKWHPPPLSPSPCRRHRGEPDRKSQ
jgi:hypothetical protein